jgi:hypothetical protein
MVEEENLEDLMLVEIDLGDGESDLDEEYAPPSSNEGIDDSVEDAEGDGIATPKQRMFLGKSPIKFAASQIQVPNEKPP